MEAHKKYISITTIWYYMAIALLLFNGTNQAKQHKKTARYSKSKHHQTQKSRKKTTHRTTPKNNKRVRPYPSAATYVYTPIVNPDAANTITDSNVKAYINNIFKNYGLESTFQPLSFKFTNNNNGCSYFDGRTTIFIDRCCLDLVSDILNTATNNPRLEYQNHILISFTQTILHECCHWYLMRMKNINDDYNELYADLFAADFFTDQECTKFARDYFCYARSFFNKLEDHCLKNIPVCSSEKLYTVYNQYKSNFYHANQLNNQSLHCFYEWIYTTKNGCIAYDHLHYLYEKEFQKTFTGRVAPDYHANELEIAHRYLQAAHDKKHNCYKQQMYQQSEYPNLAPSEFMGTYITATPPDEFWYKKITSYAFNEAKTPQEKY
jgi:hypothetical protein